MICDPFYQKIVEGLNSPLDPELFEQCAADLLRQDYATLVPVRGGSDFGMDGAIADGEGEPFPLVTTTGKDAIGNLTRNLNKYVEVGGTRKRAIFATSQSLTPRRRKNLYERASKLGFTLMQVYDQAAFADRLYRNPEWCLELLGLTGKLPALSILPKTQRPLLNLPLVGRGDDVMWLTTETHDRLIVGQPGSGKTYLLHHFAKENDGLFAVNSDMREIANDFRAQQPRVIIVDDAHTPQNLELVAGLKHFRESTGAEFDIAASCWPGDYQLAIAELLNLPEARSYELKRLSCDEIVQVIKAAGIAGSADPIHGPLNQLIREIVDQAEGRPGLAATLTHLFLQGDIQRIVSGEALSRSIMHFFLPSLDQTPKQVLAAISVGGDSGISMEAVADVLSISLSSVRNTVVDLDAGGVITVVENNLSVRPAVLRFALIRDVFCSGRLSLPERCLRQLIVQAPYPPDVARTLIGAAGRGALVPRSLITEIFEQLEYQHMPFRPTLVNTWRQDSVEDIWRMYGWLGRDEVLWILENHPERTIAIAWPGMVNAPDVAIPKMLEMAIGDHRALNAYPEHPLRLIEAWIQASYPRTGEALRRRKILLQITQDWLLSGRDLTIGLKGFRLAFSPVFETNESDPGNGNTLFLRGGRLLVEELKALQSEWSTGKKILESIEITDWEGLRDLVSDWAFWGHTSAPLSPETREVMQDLAGQMLVDLIPLMKEKPGLLHWVQRIADHLQLSVSIPVDDEFEILYPYRSRREEREDWKSAEKREIEKARALAKSWSGVEPENVIDKIIRFGQEARLAGITWPEYVRFVCYEIARQTESAQIWLEKAAGSTMQQLFIEPFLIEAARRNELGWTDVATEMMASPNRKGVVISVVLTLDSPPETLLSEVLNKLDGMGQLVETHCVRNEISELVLLRLLHHPNKEIAGVTAVGIWAAEPEGSIPISLHDVWRDAVAAWADDDYHLGEILRHDPALAETWLTNCLLREDFRPFEYGQILGKVVGILDSEARFRVLRLISRPYGLDELVSLLVGRDPELYRKLLTLKQLEPYHLSPLAGPPDESWIEQAKLASEAGYSDDEIVHAALGRLISWSGDKSEMWGTWVQRWELLCLHEDASVRKIAQAGKAYAEEKLHRALHEEYIESVYGRV